MPIPAVSGSPTQLAASVTSLANLAGLPDDAYKDGDFAYVQSTRATYQLDRTSNATPSSVAVDAFSGNGQWVFFQASTSWQTQATWYIDPAAGDDENEGSTTTTALATWAEFRRRVSMLAVSMTVTILDDLTEAILGDFYALTEGLTLTVQGTPVVVANSGLVTTYTNPVRTLGACAQGTMTASSIADFTAHVGRFLRTTTDYFAPILGVSVGLAPQLPFWANSSFDDTKPLANVVADVVTMTNVPTLQVSLHDGLLGRIKYLKFTDTGFYQSVCLTSDNTATVGNFFACDFGGHLTTPSDTYLVACQLSGSGDVYSYSPANLICGGSRRTVTVYGTMTFQGSIIQGGGGLLVGNENGLPFSPTAIVSLYGATAGLGVFGSSGVGVRLVGSAILNGTTLYGASNATYGLTADYGAKMQVSVAPTITGTSGDLLFCGAATAIPPLGAGAAVPAAQALATWGNWANVATFNSKVVNYSNGTSICK